MPKAGCHTHGAVCALTCQVSWKLLNIFVFEAEMEHFCDLAAISWQRAVLGAPEKMNRSNCAP